MTEIEFNTGMKQGKKGFGCLQVFGFIVIAVIISAVVTLFVAKNYIFRSEFKPVKLNSKEEKVLNAKLESLDDMGGGMVSRGNTTVDQPDPGVQSSPEAYSEKGAKREISFTERELNALIAKNTDLSKKLAIDLSDDLVSAKLIIPMDEDFPILGGKTIRVKTGVGFSYADSKPSVMLKGITIMGVPLPNAWLGGIKNIDLIEEFGTDRGFWKAFSDGVADISIEEGLLKIKLKE